MISKLDASHHYWLNTFTHGVDSQNSDKSIFGFLDWVDLHYGAQGDGSVWVAPSEEIESYLLVRDGIKITFDQLAENHQSYLPLISGSTNTLRMSSWELKVP